jgi:hypothetical protein
VSNCPAHRTTCPGRPEVADARQGEGRQPVEEVPHPLAAQRHLRADRVAGAEAELGDRALGLRDDRPLARDGREVTDGVVERLRVRQRLTEPDVDDDLRQARDLVGVAVFELLLERRTTSAA